MPERDPTLSRAAGACPRHALGRPAHACTCVPYSRVQGPVVTHAERVRIDALHAYMRAMGANAEAHVRDAMSPADRADMLAGAGMSPRDTYLATLRDESRNVCARMQGAYTRAKAMGADDATAHRAALGVAHDATYVPGGTRSPRGGRARLDAGRVGKLTREERNEAGQAYSRPEAAGSKSRRARVRAQERARVAVDSFVDALDRRRAGEPSEARQEREDRAIMVGMRRAWREASNARMRKRVLSQARMWALSNGQDWSQLREAITS